MCSKWNVQHMKRSPILDTHLDFKTPKKSGFDKESSLVSASIAPRYVMYEALIMYIGTESGEFIY